MSVHVTHASRCSRAPSEIDVITLPTSWRASPVARTRRTKNTPIPVYCMQSYTRAHHYGRTTLCYTFSTMMHLDSRCDLQSMSDASHPLETSGMSPRQHHQSGLLLVDEQKMVDIENPHHHDVLCGRGVTTNRHPGNESFRSLVGLNKELYVTSTKRQKMSISRSIVEAVRSLDPPGRFLEKDRNTGLWSDIGDKKAVEKTSQALRDGAANLRKQLSADMGDPDFLNAVFEYTDDCQERKSDLAKKAAIMEGEAGTAAGKTKVSSQDRMETDLIVSGRKSYEKIKVAKKAKQNPIKKGHRRTRSNPCSGTISTKNHRRIRPTEPPPSPLAQFAERYPQVPYSPRTPQPRQSVSHPNSPMTWGGRMPYHEREEGPGPQGPNPVYSNYEYSPPSPGPSPSYIHSSGERHYGRSHSYEYHYDSPCEGRPPHLSHQGSWSYSASRYQPSPYRERPSAPPSNSSTNGSGLQYSWQPHKGQEHSGYPPAGSCTPPRPPRSSSPSPASPVPQGPLPPGRHQFSPAGYRSDHRGGEWQPPRDVSRRHEAHPGQSPRNPHESSGHHADSSPRWRRSPHSHEHYSTPPPACYSTSFSNTSADRSEESGLSVPSLGAEVRHPPISSVSSRVMLSPRSWSSYGETPPRPPTMSSARDFDPPPPSPKFRRIRRYEEKYPREWEREEYDRASPPGEEKKTEFDRTESFKEENRAPYPPMIVSSSQRALHMNRRKMSSPSHSEDSIKEGEDEDEEDNALNNKSENGRSGSVRSSPTSVTRASPLSTRINNTVIEEGTEGPSKVDEIAMSPIHMGREDPTTLMELPDNILSLPISPCGPHDDPLS